MQRRQYGANFFRWPQIQDIEVYHRADLILQFEEMLPGEKETLSTGDIIWRKMNGTDYKQVTNALKRILREC